MQSKKKEKTIICVLETALYFFFLLIITPSFYSLYIFIYSSIYIYIYTYRYTDIYIHIYSQEFKAIYELFRLCVGGETSHPHVFPCTVIFISPIQEKKSYEKKVKRMHLAKIYKKNIIKEKKVIETRIFFFFFQRGDDADQKSSFSILKGAREILIVESIFEKNIFFLFSHRGLCCFHSFYGKLHITTLNSRRHTPLIDVRWTLRSIRQKKSRVLNCQKPSYFLGWSHHQSIIQSISNGVEKKV